MMRAWCACAALSVAMAVWMLAGCASGSAPAHDRPAIMAGPGAPPAPTSVMPVRTLAEARAAAPVVTMPNSTASAPSAADPLVAGPTMIEVFPHVRVDRTAKIIEFDGVVAVDCHDEVTPRVYLELFVCTPDTREHEALVVTSARPSHVHAAMLMIGLEPGAPGGVKWTGERVELVPPLGSPVRVRFRTTGAAGAAVESDPWEWVTVISGQRTVKDGTFVFTGSRFAQRQDPETGRLGEVYDADGAGTVVGLTTFGSELIGWSRVLSPDSGLQTPDWIADRTRVPKMGVPVVVVVRAE